MSSASASSTSRRASLSWRLGRSPHNAYNTEEVLERIIATTLANIEAFAQRTPGNVVSAH